MLPGPGKGNQHPQGQGLYVRTDKVKQTAPVIVVAEVDATPAVPKPARLTTEEVMMMLVKLTSTRGYSFMNTDLKDKIQSSGTRDMSVESTVQRLPHSYQ